MSTVSTLTNMNQPAEREPAEPNLSPVALAIHRLKSSKVLIAVIICFMLAIFVGCLDDKPKHESRAHHGEGDHAVTGAPSGLPEHAQPAQAQPQAQAQAPATASAVPPQLATQFITWWSGKSMDFSPATTQANHKEALSWMTPESAQMFQSCFWTTAIQQDIMAGKVTAAFQPTNVQAEAINPDGTVVVGLTGTLVMQSVGNPPVTTQMLIDFLVRKEGANLRVCGLANRTAPPAPSVVSQASSAAQGFAGDGVTPTQPATSDEYVPARMMRGGDY